MNEPFDVEISRALKESTDKALDGWEFTPAMQAGVLKRIRAEEAAAPAPTEPARPRFNPNRVIRPLAWVAVAAAAAFVMVNAGIPGASRKDSAAPASEVAKLEAPASPQPEAAADRAMAMKSAETTAASMATAEPGVLAASPTTGRQAAPFIALTVPQVTPQEALPPVKTVPVDSGRAMPGIASASTALNLDVAATERLAANVVVLNSASLQAVGPDGAVVWNRTMEGLGEQSVVAVANDGRVALGGAANQLRILNAAGETERVVYATAAVERVVWSNDGRVAAAEGSLVFVYNAADGKTDYYADAGLNGEMAFGPDGTLAVFGLNADGKPLLSLRDRKGRVVWERRPEVNGRGLAFTAGGTVVVAGGQAYDQAGTALWLAGMTTAGVAPLGENLVAVWDDRSVLVMESRTGGPIWQAGWQGAGGVRLVVSSPDGGYLAIVAETDQGPVLWVLDAGGRLIHSEKPDEMPVDAAFNGNHLLIVLPHGMTTQALK